MLEPRGRPAGRSGIEVDTPADRCGRSGRRGATVLYGPAVMLAARVENHGNPVLATFALPAVILAAVDRRPLRVRLLISTTWRM
jgi:hypothetical protein